MVHKHLSYDFVAKKRRKSREHPRYPAKRPALPDDVLIHDLTEEDSQTPTSISAVKAANGEIVDLDDQGSDSVDELQAEHDAGRVTSRHWNDRRTILQGRKLGVTPNLKSDLGDLGRKKQGPIDRRRQLEEVASLSKANTIEASHRLLVSLRQILIPFPNHNRNPSTYHELSVMRDLRMNLLKTTSAWRTVRKQMGKTAKSHRDIRVCFFRLRRHLNLKTW